MEYRVTRFLALDSTAIKDFWVLSEWERNKTAFLIFLVLIVTKEEGVVVNGVQ
jgi:hypothetical protein